MSMSVSRRSDRPRRRVLATTAVLVACAGLLSGCADWWVPQYGRGEFDAEPAPTASAAALSDQPTFDLTIDEFAVQWNASAEELGSSELVPTPIVADGTTDGVSTTTLVVGDAGDDFVTVQWVDATSEVTFVQLDLTYADPLAGSPEQDVVAIALATATGQSAEAASVEAASLVESATGGDPSSTGGQTMSTVDDVQAELSFVTGSATVFLSPVQPGASDGSDTSAEETPSPAPSAS